MKIRRSWRSVARSSSAGISSNNGSGRGTAFCVGTPEACIQFLERYEALGMDEVFLLCAIGPAQHQEVLHTIRLFGEHVIPYFQAKEQRGALAHASV